VFNVAKNQTEERLIGRPVGRDEVFNSGGVAKEAFDLDGNGTKDGEQQRAYSAQHTTTTKIDTDKVNAFIHNAYREAGLTPEDVDTGAVIITGEALKKENAQPIVENFAKYSGKFICAAAGHNHEALLAAYGCGAVDLSKSEHKTVLNVDMGGGTTKFSLVEDGVVTQTASISVGARLIAFDEKDKITRIEGVTGVHSSFVMRRVVDRTTLPVLLDQA